MSSSPSPETSQAPKSEPETSSGLQNFLAVPQDTSGYVSPYPPLTRSPTPASPAATSRGSRRSTPGLYIDGPTFDHPTSSDYYSVSSNMPGTPLSTKEKESLLHSLRTHRVNTLIELRRIEKALAGHKTGDVTEAMTQAWAHYVNSNNLLSELRGLTKSYPFSSECLDEAKWMVISDAQSNKSWNYCWLVLQKAKNQSLIPQHARQLASRPAMWGGRTPTAGGVQQLASACATEWTNALNQLLRHWEAPPTVSGR